MSSDPTTTKKAADKTPQTSELVVFDGDAKVRLAAEQANPEFDAWLERAAVETVVFLPAHAPRKKPRERWSSRKLQRLRRFVGDATAVAGEQRFEGGQPPVPGLFLPGMTRARAREVALKVAISQFFWVRTGSAFEVQQTKALGFEELFEDNVLQLARQGLRDFWDAVRRLPEDWRVAREFVFGAYWWLAVFLLGMAGIGCVLASSGTGPVNWITALPPAFVVGWRLRRRFPRAKIPDREFSMAESDAAWREVATSRAFAWLVAAAGVVLVELCRALWSSGDGVLGFVGASVTHVIVCLWLMQAVSFSRNADDMLPRALAAVFGTVFAIFGFKMMLGFMSFAMDFVWGTVLAAVVGTISDSLRELVNSVMALAAQVAFFVPMLGFTWARERALFRLWISNEMEEI